MCGLSGRNVAAARRYMAQALVVGGLLLGLVFIGVPTSAAHPAKTGDNVTLTFTVIVQAGTAADDLAFWVCADAQPDGTGCNQMGGPAGGPFTFALATATGTTYHHLMIEWTHGHLIGSNGPLPAPPFHTACPYPTLTISGPQSFTCQVDLSVATVTQTPVLPGATPGGSPANSDPPPVDKDTSTLVTGLQVVIGVGVVLLVILLIVLLWQRMSGNRRR